MIDSEQHRVPVLMMRTISSVRIESKRMPDGSTGFEIDTTIDEESPTFGWNPTETRVYMKRRKE